MGFILDEEQKSLTSMIDDFLSKELDPIVEEYDAKSELPMHVVQQCTDMGLHVLQVPEAYGGMELDDLTALAAAQTMAKHDVGVTFTMTVTGSLYKLITTCGTPEQKEKYSKIAADGGMMSFCLTEPTGSSDAATMHTTAEKKGDTYVINGSKVFITTAEIAKAFLVTAVTDRTKGPHGISTFLVDAGTPGLSVSRHESKMGMRLSPTNEVVFQDCVVPASALIGNEGSGFITAMSGLDVARMTTAAIALGVAERALAETIKYTHVREVGGKPLYKNQWIAYKLAGYAARLESCFALLEHTVKMKEMGANITKNASMCKLLCTDLAVELATDAVQYFGGYGVCTDYPVEKLYRDAKILQILEGANEIQRLVISRALPKDYL